MQIFARHLGSWHGSNGFRLMPNDPVHSAPAGATVLRAAGGALASITYNWSHPTDGVQGGLLVVGPGDDHGDGSVVAFWADSWHQHPSPRTLLGSSEGNSVSVGYEYEAGWWWRIVVGLGDPDALTIRMENVVPESAGNADFAGGAYPAMVMSLTRAVVA